MSTTEEPPNKVRKYEMESQYLEGEVTDEVREEWLSGGEILTEDGYRVVNQTQGTVDQEQEDAQESQDDAAEDPEHEGAQEYQLIHLTNDEQYQVGDGAEEQTMIQNYTLQIQTDQGMIQAQLKSTQDIQEDTQDVTQENITQESQEITQESQEDAQESQEYSQEGDNTEDNSTQYIVLPENVTLQPAYDDNNTQYFILEETLPDGSVTQQNITAEDLSQYIMLQQSMQDGAPIESTTQNSTSQHDTDDNAQNNAIVIQVQDNISQGTSLENISQENSQEDSLENISRENSLENVSLESSQENVSQENLQENVSQENILQGNSLDNISQENSQGNVSQANSLESTSQGNLSQDNVKQGTKVNTLSNIEETLDQFQREDSVTPDLPDDLDTYLIRKQLPVNNVKPVVTQQLGEDKGNDTDDLLQILGESENKAKKKVLTRKHSKRQRENQSSDDDQRVNVIKNTSIVHQSKNAGVQWTQATKNIIVNKPAPKAVPESFDKTAAATIIKKISPSVKITKVKNITAQNKDKEIPVLQRKIVSSNARKNVAIVDHQPKTVDNQPKIIYHIKSKSPQAQQKIPKYQQKLSYVPKVSNFPQKISNLIQQQNFPQKLSSVQPKVSNFQQKLSNVQPNISHVQPKLLNVQPKICNIQQKTLVYSGQPTQQHKLNTFQQKLSQYQQNNQQKITFQNIFDQKVKQNSKQRTQIISHRVYKPPKAFQQITNATIEEKIKILQQTVLNQKEKGTCVYDYVKSMDNPSKANSLDNQSKAKRLDNQSKPKSFENQSQAKSFENQSQAKTLDNQLKTKSLLRAGLANDIEQEEIPMDEDFDDTVDISDDHRNTKAEPMEYESMSDDTNSSDENSMIDYLPSSEPDDVEDWPSVDVRAERAGEYLPLLGSTKAYEILMQEKKRVQPLIQSMQKRFEGTSVALKRQAHEIKEDNILRKQLKAQLRHT